MKTLFRHQNLSSTSTILSHTADIRSLLYNIVFAAAENTYFSLRVQMQNRTYID